MEKPIEMLMKSLLISIDNLQYISAETPDINGLLLNSVIDTLKAQDLVIKNISCNFDKEKAIKNRALDFISKKGLMNEFNK